MAAPPIWTTALAAELAKAGVSSNTAGMLCQYYPDADAAGFVVGLDTLTQALTQLVRPASEPTEEPWAALCNAFDGVAQGDIEDAFQQALAVYAPDLQGAINDAVQQRLAAFQARQAQQAAKNRKAKSAEYVKALTDLGYSFRLNSLNDAIEVNEEPISDALAALIRMQMRDKGFDQCKVMEDVYLAEAYQHQYNPILDYLDGLQYDGGQHITHLASHFQDRDGVFSMWLRRWLIGAVAKIRASEQNYMMVLDGKQDLGKSTFARWLGSSLPNLFLEAPITLEDKDTYIRLCSTFVWEVSEFGTTMRRQDREALKSFLTTKVVTVRKSYGRFDMIKPATASFIGTVNNETGILNDPTGSRRFLVCCLTDINWDYSKLDPDPVWAEANAAYLAGEPWRLNPTERAKSQDINEQYEVEDPVEGLLKKFFIVNPTNPHTWTSTVDILVTLEENGLRGSNTRSNSMALSSVATKLGLTKTRGYTVNGQRVWGYQGVQRI